MTQRKDKAMVREAENMREGDGGGGRNCYVTPLRAFFWGRLARRKGRLLFTLPNIICIFFFWASSIFTFNCPRAKYVCLLGNWPKRNITSGAMGVWYIVVLVPLMKTKERRAVSAGNCTPWRVCAPQIVTLIVIVAEIVD